MGSMAISKPNDARGLARLLCCSVLLLAATPQAMAQCTSSSFWLLPPLIMAAAPPNAMLVLSNDQELYSADCSNVTCSGDTNPSERVIEETRYLYTLDYRTGTADVSILSGLTADATTGQGGMFTPLQRGRISWEILELPF